MKMEARTDRLQLTLQTLDTETHGVITDNREAVQLALDRAAAWFKLEVDRLVVGAGSGLARRTAPDTRQA